MREGDTGSPELGREGVPHGVPVQPGHAKRRADLPHAKVERLVGERLRGARGVSKHELATSMELLHKRYEALPNWENPRATLRLAHSRKSPRR
jgi:hypothetical protein